MLVTPSPFGRFLAGHGAAVLAERSAASLAARLLEVSAAEAFQVGRNAARIVPEELRWDTVAQSWSRQVEAIF